MKQTPAFIGRPNSKGRLMYGLTDVTPELKDNQPTPEWILRMRASGLSFPFIGELCGKTQEQIKRIISKAKKRSFTPPFA